MLLRQHSTLYTAQYRVLPTCMAMSPRESVRPMHLHVNPELEFGLALKAGGKLSDIEFFTIVVK